MVELLDTHYYSNAFIQSTPLHIADLSSLPVSFLVFSSVHNPELFLKRVEKYELEHDNCSMKGQKPRAGRLITFLLDKKHNKEELITISKELVNYFQLPVLTYQKKIGKGNYLVAYIYDRDYYEDGQEVVKCASHNVYRNNKGRLCKATDPDAKLVIEKGTVISTTKHFFSAKKDTFRFAKDAFKGFITKLKKWFVSILKRFNKNKVFEARPIKRFVTKNKDFFVAKNYKIWNKAFEKVEKAFSDAIYTLRMTDLYEEGYPMLKELSLSAESCRRNGAFRYGKYSFCIGEGSNLKSTRQNANLFVKVYTDKINQSMEKFMYKYNKWLFD